jgi:hypothetical protein
MAKNYDNGIVKNVENFSAYVSYCDSMDVKYMPSNPLIFKPALKAMETALTNALSDHMDKYHALTTAQALRATAFKKVKPTATKLMRVLESLEIDEGIMRNAMSYQRVIQGRRADNSKPDEPKEGEPKDDNSRSVSRQSFISLAENFEKLVHLVIAQPQYIPNETEYKAEALLACVADLKMHNRLVAKAEEDEKNSRGVRNDVMYLSTVSMWVTIEKLKAYLAYAADQNSPAYKDLGKLSFSPLSIK